MPEPTDNQFKSSDRNDLQFLVLMTVANSFLLIAIMIRVF